MEHRKMTQKRKVRALTIEFKRKVIRTVEENPTKMKNEIAKEFDIPSTTLHTILKNKHKYEEGGGLRNTTMRVKKLRFQDIEDSVVKWLEKRDKNIPMSNRVLKEKAQEFAKAFGKDDFRASNGWVHNFRKRLFPDFKEYCENINDVNVEEAQKRAMLFGQRCNEAKQRIRELAVFRSPTLRPADVIATVSATVAPDVQKYLEVCKRSIISEINICRAKVGGGSGKKKPRKAKAKKGNAAPPETATSNSSDFNLSQDGSSSRPDDQFICEASTSSATRTFTEVNIKHEGIKEELILEDYTNPSDMMEFTTTEGVEDNSKVQGDTSAEPVQSSSASAGGTFETIICGGDIKIKQEIFEDECDAVESTWAGTTENESSDPFSSAAPQCVLPTATASANVSPDMEVKLRTPLNKSLKQVPKSKVKGSGKMKAIPVSSVLKCQICVNEFFLSPSDLMEHCILKHSDASDRFLSAVDPSSQQPSIASGPPGQSSSVASTQDFSTAKPEFSAATQTGYSGTNPPDFNVTKPGPLVSNMPGQPPKNIIPPYISSCDVFDGVYVSLSQISADKRKATRNKILELVKFLSESNVNPEEVNFVIMGK